MFPVDFRDPSLSLASSSADFVLSLKIKEVARAPHPHRQTWLVFQLHQPPPPLSPPGPRSQMDFTWSHRVEERRQTSV